MYSPYVGSKEQLRAAELISEGNRRMNVVRMRSGLALAQKFLAEHPHDAAAQKRVAWFFKPEQAYMFVVLQVSK